MKIKLNNDMELVLDNENGEGTCIATLIDSSDGEIIRADVIDEQMLLEFLQSQMPFESDKALQIAEKRYKINA